VQWGDQAERRRTSDANWRKPLKWNREARLAGERPRVFCASLADVFENRPELTPWRADLLKLIYDTPHLDWLLLTKRPENWRDAIDEACEYAHGETWQSLWTQGEAPENVWMGVTVENQEQADKRIPELLQIPARVRFLSCEPLLGTIDLLMAVNGYDKHGYRKPFHKTLYGLHQVIIGGESGPRARPMHPDWARSLRDQCQAAGVSFFMKQMTKREPIPDDLCIREFPNAT
jgi:protein gp37